MYTNNDAPQIASPLTATASPAAAAPFAGDDAAPRAGPSTQPITDVNRVTNDSSSEDDDDELVPIVRAPTGPSPLQTPKSAIDSNRSDPLVTGTQCKRRSEVYYFFHELPDGRHVCTACDEMQKEDPSHVVAIFGPQATTRDLRHHLHKNHILFYVTEVERSNLKTGLKILQQRLDSGWSLEMLIDKLQNPTCTLESLGEPPYPKPGIRALSSGFDQLPKFTLDEMHHHIVKFIVADDQNFAGYFAF
ncbi:hypothetical protein EDB19DRAFT_1920372 [Suillus lakei]|nr:hypothetical protein EDB19DRAFT_1920372 [Suillus lakei]